MAKVIAEANLKIIVEQLQLCINLLLCDTAKCALNTPTYLPAYFNHKETLLKSYCYPYPLGNSMLIDFFYVLFMCSFQENLLSRIIARKFVWLFSAMSATFRT